MLWTILAVFNEGQMIRLVPVYIETKSGLIT